MTSSFQPATRQQLKAKVGAFGPTKSGKSLTMLLMARGVVGDSGRIAVVDTEGDRVRLYAADPRLVTAAQPTGFDHLPMTAPYTPERFAGLIAEAQAAGYDAVVFDTITPFWDGPGGVLSMVDAAKRRGAGQTKGGLSPWIDATPAHNQVIAAITQCPIHLFCTMRAKMAYSMETDEKGKSVVRKLGLQPVQRDNIEYEFDVLVEMDAQHSGTLSARGSFQDRVVPFPGIDLGQELRVWMDAGGGITDSSTPAAAAPQAEDRVTKMMDGALRVGMIDPNGGKFWIAESDVASRQAEGWTLAHPRNEQPDTTTRIQQQPAGLPIPASAEPNGRLSSEQSEQLARLGVELTKLRGDIAWGDYLNQIAGERYASKNGVAGLTTEQAGELIELAEQTRLSLSEGGQA